MATSDQGKVDLSFEAAGDLSAKQYLFMKLDSDGKVTTCTGATDKPIGILQNKPDAAGKAATVRVSGVSKVVADGTLDEGNLVGTSADGQCDAKTPGTDTTEYVVGTCLKAAAAGEVTSVLINCAAPHRAA